jgi:hypothetical protein
MTEIYADGKPRDCRACYYYEKKNGCTLSRCYYLINDKPRKKSECDDCPYGKCGPCIGWCTKEILRSVRGCAK